MMSRSDWEIPYLRNKHLSLMLLTAITAEGKNKWLKSSILPAGIKRWCYIRHFETQSNHTSFWGAVPLRAHSEALDNSDPPLRFCIHAKYYVKSGLTNVLKNANKTKNMHLFSIRIAN